MLKKPSPLKKYDKFQITSGASEQVEKYKKEREDRKRKEEEKIKTVAEEQRIKEEEEKKLEEEKKIQEDTAKYQKRIDAGEITVEQAQKEYKEQIKKEEEEKVTVIKDGKKLSWDQVKDDDKLYNSLTLNEKRKLARGKNLKNIKELGEDITAAPEKSNIDNKPSVAKDLLAHIGRGWTSSAKGVLNQVEAMQFGLASLALNPKNKEEKMALHAAIKNINQTTGGGAVLSDSRYNAAMKMFDANIRKYENESITEDLKDGNYGQAGYRTVGAALESMPSLVAAFTGWGGLGVLAASVSGNKFEEEFEKNPEESTGRLLLNAGGTGILESTFELVTRGVMKRAGLLAGQGKVKAAKELLAGGGRNIAKNMGLAITGGAASESATEASSLLLEAMPKSFPGGLGRDIVWKDHFYQLADAGIVGSFVDGTISTVGGVNNGNQRSIDRAEVILAPKEINDRLNEKIHIINKLAEDLPTASKEGKELINERIENEYQEVIKIKKENSVALQNLEGKDLQDYATNKEQINKNAELAQKSTNDSEKQEALKRVTELRDKNKSILDVAKKKAYKKDIETVTKQASTYFGDKVEVVEADTQEKSAELLETSIHERRIALEEELKSIEDQNSGPAVKIKEEIDDLKADLKDIRNLKKQPGQQSLATGAYFSHGYITPADQGGRRKIIVNKEAALKAGFVTTGQHEFVHAILNETIKDSPDIQVALGEALGAHLGAIDKGEIKDSEYRQRIYDYIKSPVNVRAEEMLPLLSEAMSRKDLKFDEGIFTGLKDKFRQYFQKIGLKDIQFNNGRDVYNFIKDFNKSVATGKTNKAIQELARKGAKGKLVKGEKGTPTIKQSKEASDNVQRIYEEQGVGGAFDIIDQFKPITNKLVERRREAPGFDKQLLTDEVETGKRGIFDLIKEYKPESGVPLAAYINKYLPARAIEASKRVLGEEFTDDISERVDIAAEEVTTEVKAKPKPKKIILSERLGVTSKVSKAIEKLVPTLQLEKLNFKSLKNKIPSITGELFGIVPKKIETLANLSKGELQSAQMFINKNADLLINMLPEGSTPSGTATGVPNSLLKEFYTKTDRAKMAKTGSKAGLAVQQKNNINKKDFLEVFGIIDGKPDRTDRNTSARVLALANLTGKMITNQAVRIELSNIKNQQKNINKIAEGKSAIMFSKNAKEFKIDGTIDKLLQTHIDKVGRATYKFKTKEDVDLYIEALIDQILPLMPRGFFFNKPEGDVNTGSEFTDSDRMMDVGKKTVKGVDVNKKVRKDLYEYYVARINALNSLPDAAFGSPIKGVTDFQRSSYETLFENKKGIQVEKIKEVNEKSGKIHEAMWRRMYKAIQDNPSHAAVIGNFFKAVGNRSNHWHRYGAERIGYSPRPKGDTKRKYEYEHAMPATASYLYLINSALDGLNFDSVYKPVMDNFKLIALDKAENSKLGKAKLGTKMPEGWNAVDNNWWERYFNTLVSQFDGGINPESIITLEGQTLGDLFQINAEGKPKPVQPGTDKAKTLDKTIIQSRKSTNPSKGITVLDFDDTLATSKSKVISTAPDGTVRKLTAEQFAREGADLLEQGWKHNFSEFNKVVKGKVASLFNKAMKLQGKFGPENMFVLTARPQESARSIYEFLKANGLNIPMKNITGLANSTAEAKALWMADKVADGYNDFYFADDALQNVQAVKNMLSQFDVKSKVQQAKIKFSKDISGNFNNIIEGSTGIESQKEFSNAQAKLRGQKTKYKSIIPASAQDFQGLLYNFLSKGKQGEADMAFFKKALIDPFSRGINELNSSRQTAANDFKNLNKKFPKVKKVLNKKIKDLDYTNDQAIRVYLWNKAGFEIPGLSKRDLKALTDVVMKNPEIQAYADTIGLISKKDDGYSQPKDYWLAESIASDLLSDGAIGDKRSDFLNEWIENKNMIFSPKNLNKIEAIYGAKFREALEDILYRMETGRNRPMGGGRLVNSFMNWTNNSVGAIMFLNLRSATLQTISAANYMNWSDNNPAKAATAFANQPQFWKDFAYIFNSDYLKQRRSGNQRGVNEAELSEAIAGSDNKAKTAIAWLLKKGFTPTQIADSFAISMGGSTFYRNRIKKYVKDGMSQKDAEIKAWLDFQEITEVNQQSARPDMISQQQASPLGRLILAFQNTPMQYARIMNKAARDLVNGRGDYKTHVSKIAYYGIVQGIIFGALQSALYASLGEDEEEEFDKKKERILNQMVDSWLTGIGYGGKAIGTIKNTIMKYLEQRDKGFRSDHAYTLLTLLSFSPPIGSKLRKVYSSIKTEEFNRGVFSKRGFSLDNPIWSGVGNVVEGVTNIPLGRISNLMLQADNAMDPAHDWWQRVALLLGQNTWDLGIQDPDIEAAKLEVKEERKIEREKERLRKKAEKEEDKKQEEEAKIEENKEKSKKDGVCSAISKGGKRCKSKAVNDGFCTVHEKAEQNETGKQSQCKKIKDGGKRCKMQTSSKSGYCYYHD